jgi:hypothetical protein
MDPAPITYDPTVGYIALALALVLLVGGAFAAFRTASKGLNRLDGDKRDRER